MQSAFFIPKLAREEGEIIILDCATLHDINLVNNP